MKSMVYEQSSSDSKKNSQKENKNKGYNIEDDVDDLQETPNENNQDVSIEGQFQDRGHSHKKSNLKSRK